jgi:hypothetical protein
MKALNSITLLHSKKGFDLWVTEPRTRMKQKYLAKLGAGGSGIADEQRWQIPFCGERW